jgi:Fe-S-cluster-containing hydrogenase component 2
VCVCVCGTVCVYERQTYITPSHTNKQSTTKRQADRKTETTADMAARRDEERNIFRIAPYHYVHVLDQNKNITRVRERRGFEAVFQMSYFF